VVGQGYWWGKEVRVDFLPAPANHGIVFVRVDLPGRPSVPARVEHRVETPRRTSLQRGAARVEMIEHIMAALTGSEIDNCEIRVTECEMPACGGSSRVFVEAFKRAGIVEQPAIKPRVVIQEIVRVSLDDQWLEARPTRSGRMILSYELDYGSHSPIRPQFFSMSLTSESFDKHVADCRTFLLRSEAEALLAQGMGRHTSYRDLLVFDHHGPVDNRLLFPDECARHKVLDMIGDLALGQVQWVGHFYAHRSGHRLNAMMVAELLARQQALQHRRQCA